MPYWLAMTAEQSQHLLGKGRIGCRQIHVTVIQQPQIDRRRRQQRTGWLLAAGDGAVLDPAHTLDPADTGVCVSIDRVGLHHGRSKQR